MFDLPVHPIFVHFPVALLTLAWVLLVIHYWSGAGQLKVLAGFAEGVGVLTLPITIVSGLIDTGGLSFVTAPQWDLPLVWHFLAAVAGSIVFSIHGVARFRAARAGVDIRAGWDLGLSTVGFWLILFAGVLAGELVYGA